MLNSQFTTSNFHQSWGTKLFFFFKICFTKHLILTHRSKYPNNYIFRCHQRAKVINEIHYRWNPYIAHVKQKNKAFYTNQLLIWHFTCSICILIPTSPNLTYSHGSSEENSVPVYTFCNMPVYVIISHKTI